MLQKVMDLFNIVLFGEYVAVGLIFTVILVKLYFATLKRIENGKSFKVFVVLAMLLYALLIAFMIYTVMNYGFITVAVTSIVMYIIMYYPMKKFTNWIEQKGTEIALS